MRSVGPLLAGLILLTVWSTACSADEAEPAVQETTAGDVDGEISPSTTAVVGGGAPGTADESSAEPGTADETGAEPGAADEAEAGLDADLGALGVATIELVTPETGGGRRPVLAWQPVDEAVEYQVVLLAPSGDPYWGWITGGTSVPVGGEPALDAVAAGPSIVAGMTWSVSAYGTDADLVGLSGHRSIGP